MVVDGYRAVHEPSAAGKVCRKPSGLLPHAAGGHRRPALPSRQPEPSPSPAEHRRNPGRPCHPRAMSSGHQRYVADRHGHSDEAAGLSACPLSWDRGGARNCMACKGSCRCVETTPVGSVQPDTRRMRGAPRARPGRRTGQNACVARTARCAPKTAQTRTSSASASMPAATATPICSASAGSSATPSSSGAAATSPSQPSWPLRKPAVTWLEVLQVASALQRHYQPVKMNYQTLGNVVPHLHTHLLSRFAQDPAPGRPLPFPEGERPKLPRGDLSPGCVGLARPGLSERYTLGRTEFSLPTNAVMILGGSPLFDSVELAALRPPRLAAPARPTLAPGTCEPPALWQPVVDAWPR